MSWGTQRVKVCFYIVQYPVHWTGQSALHGTPWQTCSFRQQLDFSWKHSSHIPITRQEHSFTFPTQSIARYSFAQLSELGRQWREKNHPNFETVAKGVFEPDSFDCESGIILLLSCHAPLITELRGCLISSQTC